MCCPEGTQCGPDNKCYTASGRHTHPALESSWVSKLKTVPRNATIKKVQDVYCPNGIETCKDGYTCCYSLSGNYACCPDSNAICCFDDTCCPRGTKCGYDGYCYKSGIAAQKVMVMAIAKQMKKVGTGSIICPNGGTCLDGNTCCSSGCCPVANANCCPDGVHCCPGGYTCGPDKCYASGSFSHPLLLLKTSTKNLNEV